MSIDITTEDLDLQTVELLPARAALGGYGGYGAFKAAHVNAWNSAYAINTYNYGYSNAAAAAVQNINVLQY